jgi:succinate-semialdehyde dehydrogenase/glutarate-semialdehyde dehydrogenase
MGRGETQSTEAPETVVSRNPATGAVVAEVPEADAAAVERAVADARAAQPAWADRPVAERLAVLNRFRDLLLDRRAAVVATVREETARPRTDVVAADVAPTLDTVEYLDRRGAAVLEESVPTDRPIAVGDSRVVREPLGVVAAVAPWNLPLAIPATQVLPALFAGNAVVLKPAEQTPATADALADLLADAGLPADVFQVVHGRGSVTGQALTAAAVDQVSFTGSSAVGTTVAETCGARGIPTCIEGGGSDPAVVLPDADLDHAADAITWARFAVAGQTCGAVKRVYAHRAVVDALRERLLDRVAALSVGADGDHDVGPLIEAAAVDRLHDQVRRSVEMGAEVLVGGEPLDREGHFYPPTVLTNVTPEMPVMRAETFGPVLPVAAVDDVEAAVTRANDTRYGLNASVWTRDVERGERVARRLQAGTVLVNEHLYTFGLTDTPWGGPGDSGGDRAHGRWSLEHVTREQHVHVTPGERGLRRGVEDLWWFPYEARTAAALDRAMDLLYRRGIGDRLRAAPRVLREVLRNR